MPRYSTVTPAYGRDYRSRTAALADWNKGKDFIINTLPTDPDDGRYCSKRDFEDQPNVQISIRFNSLRSITKVPTGKPNGGPA